MLRKQTSRNQMRSAARNNQRFDPDLGITNLNKQSQLQSDVPTQLHSPKSNEIALAVDGETVQVSTPQARLTDTNRRSGKSHTAFGLRHVDISLRTIFLPVAILTTKLTLGSRHEALFQRISFTFHGTLATTLAFASSCFCRFFHFFFKADMMDMVFVMENDAWETQEWMEPKFASLVAVWPHLSSSGHFVMMSK